MRIALIVAVSRNGVIGRNGAMPWHLPADLRRFKRTTLGKPVVMGRRTHESIGRPLSGRTNIVVTHDSTYLAEGCTVVHSVDAALVAARAAAENSAGTGPAEVMIIGGGAMYAAFLPRADRIYLTRVDADVAGDTRFPVLDPAEWREIDREERPADAHNAYACEFLVLDRRR
jgi:dihydrofolate reductase